MILVTGATGTVGSQLVRDLLAEGHDVRALVRDTGRARERLGDDVDLAVGDLDDPPSISRALVDISRLVLLVGNDPRQVDREVAVIDAAAAARVERVVKVSAWGAEPGSRVDFWDWHARIEAHLASSGLPAVVLRPAFYMTGLLASADSIRTQSVLAAPAAGARIAMVDPADVAAVGAAAVTSDDEHASSLVLTGPEATSFDDVAATLTAMLQREVRFVAVPDEAALGAMHAAGMPDWLPPRLIQLFGALREGTHAVPTGDVDMVLGRSPATLEAFLRKHAAAFGA